MGCKHSNGYKLYLLWGLNRKKNKDKLLMNSQQMKVKLKWYV